MLSVTEREGALVRENDDIQSQSNILTIDIEDWQQSESDVLYGGGAGPFPMDAPSKRVIDQTLCLLDLLAEYDVRTTCFVLGSVAESHPALVRQIAAQGHEIAIHGYAHKLVYAMRPDAFRADVARALAAVEDCIGMRVLGYRAPYFSITRRTPWALKILAELGLTYDASIFPCTPALYRVPGWNGWGDVPRYPHTMMIDGQELIEFPATTWHALGLRLPLAGGTALRVAPVGLLQRAIIQANAGGHPAILYLHPHDMDPDTPPRKLAGDSLRVQWLRWQLRIGRSRTASRLRGLMTRNRFVPIQEWLAQSHATVSADDMPLAHESVRVP